MKLQNVIHILIGVVCIGLLPTAQAVVPAPDGGYPNFTTAEGTKALQNLTTGSANTAVGWFSLFSNTDGSFNTAVGAGTLLFNIGDQATFHGIENTAVGAAALLFNTDGYGNTAVGAAALLNHTHGSANTAIGRSALSDNVDGSQNSALGNQALTRNVSGNQNTALGDQALYHCTGNSNVAVGNDAGGSLSTGNGNVCIGDGVLGVAGESDTTRIRNVYSSVASGRAVYVNSDNKIGTLASSRRFKDEIRPMYKKSEAILALKPVTFRYKKEVEPNGGAMMFGLIAEEVEKVAPELVTRNDKGQVETVRYDAVNAMLLSEFLKEHKTVQEQGATIARLQKQIEALTAGLQRVSAQLEVSKPAPQVVNNNQ